MFRGEGEFRVFLQGYLGLEPVLKYLNFLRGHCHLLILLPQHPGEPGWSAGAMAPPSGRYYIVIKK